MILVNFLIFLSKLLFFCERKSQYAIRSKKTSNLLICSFIMSDLSKSLTVARLSWATWAIHLRSLFWHEQPERFAHSHSFVLSDLRESLTVAHLIWVIWANEQMSDKQIPNSAYLLSETCGLRAALFIFLFCILEFPAIFNIWIMWPPGSYFDYPV